MDYLTPTVTHFGDSAEWTGVMDTDREKWLDMRHQMLTASDVASILGHNPHASALSVYVDKITPRKDQEVIGLDDPRFWGTVLEQPILTAVARHHGWNYRRGGALLRSRKYPWLGATLDAEVDRHDGRGWVVLEGKTTRVTREWDEESQNLPTHILLQAQTQLIVSDAPVDVVFALLLGSRPCQVVVEPMNELHALIVEESQAFMERVRSMDPPDPDHREATKRALERLHGDDDGSSVALPAPAVEWARELIELSRASKEIEKRRDEITNLLRASIGSATYGVLSEPVDGKECFSWKTQERSEYVVKASKSRVLRAIKKAPSSQEHAALPQASPLSTLGDELRGSLDAGTAANVVPISRKRRRAKR